MASTALTREEGIGLAISIAGHVGLIAFLVLRPAAGTVVVPPERVEVTLSDDVGLTSTSPEPNQDAAADVAPVIGEAAQPEPEAVEPEPVRPTPVAQPEPPKPAPRAVSRPQPRPAAKPRPQPSSRPETRAAPPPRQASRPAPRPPERAGGSRIGADFLQGVRGAQSSGSSTSPRAAQIGPGVRSALSGAITRQLKPHWIAPQGPDAEELVTILAWNLNSDGSLDGTPRVVEQLGVNEVNRAQASRHAEQAIRAVQLAAPFNLPSEYYDQWKRISAFRFDKRLSQ